MEMTDEGDLSIDHETAPLLNLFGRPALRTLHSQSHYGTTSTGFGTPHCSRISIHSPGVPVSPRTPSPVPHTSRAPPFAAHLGIITPSSVSHPSISLPQEDLRSWRFRRWVGHAGILVDLTRGKRDVNGVQPGWCTVCSDASAIVFDGPGERRGIRNDEHDWFREERQRKGRGKETISADALILPLLIITFSCAMADAGTLVTFQTFATSMTGNTVLLAISTSGLLQKPPIYAAVSLLTFCGAGFVFGQLGAVLGQRHRSWLLSSVVFQVIALALAAWSVSPIALDAVRVGGSADWVYLFLMGLQGGPQVVFATNAGVRELPTAMMTTPYAAFISDPSLFTLPSSKGSERDVVARNRRFLHILFFWAGAFTGGALLKRSSLWLMTCVAAACKVIVVGMIWASRGTHDHGKAYDDEASL